MAANTAKGGGRRGIAWRLIGWSAAALILLLPLVVKAPWTLFDFLLLGASPGGAGLVAELVARASGSTAYRMGLGVALAAAFLLFFVNGAVGFLGNEDNPANLIFLVVFAIAIMGSILARFRAAGMAQAMCAAAATQLLVGLIALTAGLGSPGYHGLYEVVMGTSLFCALWLISGGLFRRAAGKEASAAAALWRER